ncbi:MAG: general secretion pathway protein GspE [Myxococcaceae bacterium]|nr:MAG: general secretion pathway protein GspE [Myxococcaceae bacterium]
MRKKIGELLVQAGVVTDEQVKQALASGRRGQGRKLGEVLVSMGLCTGRDIARALAAQHELPFVEIPEYIPHGVASLVSMDFQTEHRVLLFALEQDGKPLKVFVASSDDMDQALARGRGEPLDIVEAEPMDEMDDADDSPDILPSPPPAPARSSARPPAPPPLDWDLPPPPPSDSRPDGADVLEDLLGAKPRAAPPKTTTPDFSEEDLAVLDDIERISRGEEASLDTEKVKPARMVASLIRLLIRKGLIQESEFLEELAQK